MEEVNVTNQIIARCWTDEAFKQSLKSDPKKVLAEFGIQFDDSIVVNVIDDEPGVKTFVIPPKPDEGELGEILEGRKAATCSSSGEPNGCCG
ncbi:MAG: NHLP leader peptide family RiPP precursor [Verrucomicrobiota bacterium]